MAVLEWTIGMEILRVLGLQPSSRWDIMWMVELEWIGWIEIIGGSGTSVLKAVMTKAVVVLLGFLVVLFVLMFLLGYHHELRTDRFGGPGVYLLPLMV